MTDRPTLVTATRLPANVEAELAEHYHVLGPLVRSAPDALPPGAEAARGLVTMGTLKTDRALIDALPNLGVICCFGTGYEGVDRAYAADKGIVLANAGDINAPAVAEMTIGLILALSRGIVAGDAFVRAGSWQGSAVQRMTPVPGLLGRKLGIYGLGAIGSRIAGMAEAFGVEIAYHNRTKRADVPYAYQPSLLALAEWADILVVAARAGAANRHAINEPVLRALGPEGHVVNISRGIAVDETALCAALEQGWIAGAALDVFEFEPKVPEPLKTMRNVVLTPHLAGNSIAAQLGLRKQLMRNLEDFFAGRTPIGVVR